MNFDPPIAAILQERRVIKSEESHLFGDPPLLWNILDNAVELKKEISERLTALQCMQQIIKQLHRVSVEVFCVTKPIVQRGMSSLVQTELNRPQVESVLLVSHLLSPQAHMVFDIVPAFRDCLEDLDDLKANFGEALRLLIAGAFRHDICSPRLPFIDDTGVTWSKY